MKHVIVILAIAAIAVVCAPIATLWALNTLFPTLAIPYTLETWGAAFLLNAVVSGQGLSFSRKS